jgi:hypothetical protein
MGYGSLQRVLYAETNIYYSAQEPSARRPASRPVRDEAPAQSDTFQKRPNLLDSQRRTTTGTRFAAYNLDPTLTEFSQILTELYSVLPNALSPPTLVPAAG